MVMSRDPGLKFQKLLFSPNFVLNLGKITRCGENCLKNKEVTGEKQVGSGNIPHYLRWPILGFCQNLL